jgi:hypothetical protein
MMSLDHDLANVAALDAPDKFAENNFRFAPVLFAKNAENPKQNERQDQPKCNMFC